MVKLFSPHPAALQHPLTDATPGMVHPGASCVAAAAPDAMVPGEIRARMAVVGQLAAIVGAFADPARDQTRLTIGGAKR